MVRSLFLQPTVNVCHNMQDFQQLLQNVYTNKAPILDAAIPKKAYVKVNLSTSNPDLTELDISNPRACEEYVGVVIRMEGGTVGYGGYLEKRNLYEKSARFNSQGISPRNIHLGIDFWTSEGTTVHAPIKGMVHSTADNKGAGDYGPTVILCHGEDQNRFYSLYGHLSRFGLQKLSAGTIVEAGEVLGWIGSLKENGGYAPHLHFQLILDIGNFKGNYPGVCDEASLELYRKNCPDPEILLNLSG